MSSGIPKMEHGYLENPDRNGKVDTCALFNYIYNKSKYCDMLNVNRHTNIFVNKRRLFELF